MVTYRGPFVDVADGFWAIEKCDDTDVYCFGITDVLYAAHSPIQRIEIVNTTSYVVFGSAPLTTYCSCANTFGPFAWMFSTNPLRIDVPSRAPNAYWLVWYVPSASAGPAPNHTTRLAIATAEANLPLMTPPFLNPAR